MKDLIDLFLIMFFIIYLLYLFDALKNNFRIFSKFHTYYITYKITIKIFTIHYIKLLIKKITLMKNKNKIKTELYVIAALYKELKDPIVAVKIYYTENNYSYSDKISDNLIDVIMMLHGINIFGKIGAFQFNNLSVSEQKDFLNSLSEIKKNTYKFAYKNTRLSIYPIKNIDDKLFLFNFIRANKDTTDSDSQDVHVNYDDFKSLIKEHGIEYILLSLIFEKKGEYFFNSNVRFNELNEKTKEKLISSLNFKSDVEIKTIEYLNKTKIELTRPKYSIINKHTKVKVDIIEYD